MDPVFISVLNRAITAVFVIPTVMLLRLFLKRSPKYFLCILWAIAAVRLVCPFSFESAFSLMPAAETVSLSVVRYAEEPEIHSGIPALNQAVNPALRASFTPAPGASVNPLQIWLSAAGVVWLAGMTVMAGAALAGLFRLRRSVREAVLWKDNVWICDHVETPFLSGIFGPRIYLPSGMEEAQIPYVLAHEQAHLRRRDHWWKLLAYLLLSVYWFHPLVWAAYVLFGRDMEQACDERVIREYDIGQKKSYARAMLSCSMRQRPALSFPPAFGETGVKKRVKAVLGYQKPVGRMTAAAAAVCIAAAVICQSSRPAAQEQENPDKRPMLKMGDEMYVDPYMPESGLPYGYEPAGTLTAEQAYNTGMEGLTYYTNPENPDDFYVYQECGTPVDIHTIDSETLQWAYQRWVKVVNDGVENRRLTLDEVEFLAEKGMDLSWEDFDSYTYTETGSGLYIRIYEIDGIFSVWTGGAGYDEKPMYIYLIAKDGNDGDRIDLRTDDPEEFIAAHRRMAATAP